MRPSLSSPVAGRALPRPESTRPAHTYSIVAHDPESNQLGVAVQSHYFSVGPVVPWAEPGVGAVATQSFVDVRYGPLGLALMRAGKSAEDALAGLLASDPQSDVRQVAMVDAQGNAAAHTGVRCIAEAGHRKGAHYSVQANLMLRNSVWDAMAEAFERTQGDLAERLVVALEAAEAEGGDIRGKQSAALLVVSGDRGEPPWSGRVFDLRVDDHREPLPELRRLLAIARAYRHGDQAEAILVDESLGPERVIMAREEYDKAVAMMPAGEENPEWAFWYAVALVRAGLVEDALPLFRQAFSIHPDWRHLVLRIIREEFLPDDPRIIERIMQLPAGSPEV